MSEFTGLLVEGLVAFGVVLLAHAIGALLARTSESHDKDARGLRLRRLVGLVLMPLLVLLLSPLAMRLTACHEAMGVWLPGHEAHVRAWGIFWWIMLLLGVLEFAWRGWYAWRDRTFPIPALMRDVLRVVLVGGVALLVAKGVLGTDISTALASTALITAVIGFALQGVLGHVLAGMSLHLSQSTATGDWVAIGDIEGEVLETTWRETRLRTLEGHRLHVPNSKVAEAVLHNMSRPTPRRRHRVEVGASYSDAPGDVIDALVQAALSVPEVLKVPQPSAYVLQYLDFGINYVLRYWTDCYQERQSIDGDVQRMIWYQFKRRGIEIPFPMSDKLLNDFMEVVHHQNTQPPPDSEVERRVGDLLRSDFCRKLLADAEGRPMVTPQELESVAREVRHVRFTKGETIFRQGDGGETAYVVVQGTVQGRVEHPDAPATIFELGPGSLFGEMNLMTGNPRNATLTAPVETELLAIPKEAFARLLALRPEMPEKLSELVAQRAAQNAAAYARSKAAGSGHAADALRQRTVLERFMTLLGRR